MKTSIILLLIQTVLFEPIRSETLRISTVEYEPFFYQNGNGEFYKGIEYQIVETIVKKLNMLVSYQMWHGYPQNYDQLLSK